MPPATPPNTNPNNNAIPPVPPPNHNLINNSRGLKLGKRLFLILILILLALHVINVCLQVYIAGDLIAENEILKNLNEAKKMEVLWWKAFRIEKSNPVCHCVLNLE
jgi:hypothetical protein